MNSEGEIHDSDDDFDETANFDLEADQCIEESGETIVPQSIQSVISQSSVFMRPVGSHVPSIQLTKNGVSNYNVKFNLIKQTRPPASKAISELAQNMRFSSQDLQNISNALISHFNKLSCQIFELHDNFLKLIMTKPKNVFKQLSVEYQNRIQIEYGHNIISNVIQTRELAFPQQ